MDVTMQAFVDLFEKRPWILVAAVVIGLTMRLLKSDMRGPTVQPKHRFPFVYVLGLLSGLLEKKFGASLEGLSVTWMGGLVGGVLSASLAVIGHNAFIGWLRGGKELPIPGLTKTGVPPGPGKPPSIPPASPPSSSADDEGKDKDKE